MTLAALALVLLAPAAPRPEPLVTYAVVEALRSVTPRGSRERAWSGTVAVAGGRARFSLTGSAFPETRATLALSDAAGVTLVDLGEKVAARASREEFFALFRPASEEAGPAAARLADVSVAVTPGGPGRPRDGVPTTRWAVSLSWTMKLSEPGRIVTVTHATKGTVDVADGFEDARSPFDDLSRLFVARGEAREKLDAELRKIAGLPVAVSLESASEVSSEPAGLPGGGPAEGAAAPVKSTSTVTRTITALSRRARTSADDALFLLPDDVRSRSLDRLLAPRPVLP